MAEVLAAPDWAIWLIIAIFGGQSLYFGYSKSYFRSVFPLGLKVVDRSQNPLEHTCVTVAFALVAVAGILILALK